MVKLLAATALCAIALAGCGTDIIVPASSPSPPAQSAADSPAADLRAHVDLLIGEHTIVLAKLALAAAAGHKDEYHAYAGLLAVNGGDVTSLFRTALGETQGSQVGQAWSQANDNYVSYMVAAVTHDQAKANTAMSNLNNGYEPRLAQLLNAALSMSMDAGTQLATDQVAGTKLIVDDAVAGHWPEFYLDLTSAYSTAVAAGDTLSAAIASRFPDKFPGAITDSGVTLRVQLDSLLQEHSYLLTMTTGATIQAAAGQKAAAGGALSQSAGELARVIGGTYGSAVGTQASSVLGHLDASELAYAQAAGTAARQSALTNLGVTTAPELASFVQGSLHATVDAQGQVQAAVQVINDQRAKSYTTLALDDREAALLLAEFGDAIGSAPRG